jgi:hypothetical protein
VKGKYGYVDETGEVRIVEYGANKYGFQPSGKGITVAPPTLVDETTNKDGINPDYDEYEAPVRRPQPQAPRASRPRPIEQPQYFNYEEPKAAPAPVQAPRPKYTQTDVPTGPAPPRLQIPGAAPAQDVTYSDRPRPPRPENQYSSQQNFGVGPQQFPTQQQQHQLLHHQPQPAPQPSFRAVNKPQHAFLPAPQPKQAAYSAPRFAPQQPEQYFAPQQPQQHEQAAPQPQPQPQQYAPQPKQYSQGGRSNSGLLDQLAKDYALPQGGSPALHDITFGFY